MLYNYFLISQAITIVVGTVFGYQLKELAKIVIVDEGADIDINEKKLAFLLAQDPKTKKLHSLTFCGDTLQNVRFKYLFTSLFFRFLLGAVPTLVI